MEQDVTKKIRSAKVVSKTFTPDGGQPTAYKQFVVEVVIGGNLRQIPFKLNADRALILEAATDVDEQPIV